jgi:nicotinamidase-related amidase
MKVLLVVDVQNDFVTGALANPEAYDKIPAIKEKIQQRLAEGWTVMFTQDTHYNSYSASMEGKYLPVPHCIDGTWGWQIVDEIKELEESTPYMSICKHRFGDEALFEKIISRLFPNWRSISHDAIEEIELIGFCTDICVVSNALILKASVDNDTIISCDASCCAGTSIEAHNAALTVMKSCQVEVQNG